MKHKKRKSSLLTKLQGSAAAAAEICVHSEISRYLRGALKRCCVNTPRAHPSSADAVCLPRNSDSCDEVRPWSLQPCLDTLHIHFDHILLNIVFFIFRVLESQPIHNTSSFMMTSYGKSGVVSSLHLL